ncbi:MAG: hypothetical protein HC875_32910 [Anaerolineales bacterium]|nr:hypothetical protein [Anaerolineales bacterium]
MENHILIITEEEVRSVLPSKRDEFIIESIAKKANKLGQQGLKIISLTTLNPDQIIMANENDYCYEFTTEKVL